MTIAEKVNQSANGTLFTVHKEGLFYKCYNAATTFFKFKIMKKQFQVYYHFYFTPVY